MYCKPQVALQSSCYPLSSFAVNCVSVLWVSMCGVNVGMQFAFSISGCDFDLIMPYVTGKIL